jgi:hypothetical protein
MDLPLLILGVLLIATITAFLLDIFPYPFGIIVLSAFFIARLLSLKNDQ